MDHFTYKENAKTQQGNCLLKQWALCKSPNFLKLSKMFKWEDLSLFLPIKTSTRGGLKVCVCKGGTLSCDSDFVKSLPDNKPYFLFSLHPPGQEELDIFGKPPKKQDIPSSLLEQMASVEHNNLLNITFKSLSKRASQLHSDLPELYGAQLLLLNESQRPV